MGYTETNDGYVLRIFVFGFTKNAKGNNYNNKLAFSKKKTHVKASHIRKIRKNMEDIIIKEVKSSDLNKIIQKLNTEVIANKIERLCSGIYPLCNCIIRKEKNNKSKSTNINLTSQKILAMNEKIEGNPKVTNRSMETEPKFIEKL